jgi:hypothetical protein
MTHTYHAEPTLTVEIIVLFFQAHTTKKCLKHESRPTAAPFSGQAISMIIHTITTSPTTSDHRYMQMKMNKITFGDREE